MPVLRFHTNLKMRGKNNFRGSSESLISGSRGKINNRCHKRRERLLTSCIIG